MCTDIWYQLVVNHLNQNWKTNAILKNETKYHLISANLFLVMLKGDVSKLTRILSSWAVTTDLLDDIPKISLKTVRSVE